MKLPDGQCTYSGVPSLISYRQSRRSWARSRPRPSQNPAQVVLNMAQTRKRRAKSTSSRRLFRFFSPTVRAAAEIRASQPRRRGRRRRLVRRRSHPAFLGSRFDADKVTHLFPQVRFGSRLLPLFTSHASDGRIPTGFRFMYVAFISVLGLSELKYSTLSK